MSANGPSGHEPFGQPPTAVNPSIGIRGIQPQRGNSVPLALLLLMLGILADDHHVTLALDDLALFANGLYRRTNLHWKSSLTSLRPRGRG